MEKRYREKRRVEDYLYCDGIAFHFLDMGDGLPFVFQHGLGGDLSQPLELYSTQPGVRFITMDCRGHGTTWPIGDPEKFSFATFAADLMALMGYLQLAPAVVGGISMGAGVALNLTLRYPNLVRALILVRPAWLDRPLPDSLLCMVEVGDIIRRFGVQGGRERLLASPTYAAIAKESPYAAASLLGQFDEPRAEEALVRLERMPLDAPNRDRREWASISVPTLVVGNHTDPTHPFAFAETLAEAIPKARLVEVTSKGIDTTRHIEEARGTITSFLREIAGHR